MSEPAASLQDTLRLREACDWIQRLSEPHEDVLLEQWMQWCSDPSNLSAFEHMQHLWRAFPQALNELSIAPDEMLSRPSTRRWFASLAASLVIAVGGAGWLALRHSSVQSLETAVGEQRHIALGDGSQLDLAPDSRVRTQFSVLRHEVELERGQAYFAAAHGTTRPLIVRANELAITASEAVFDVRIDPDSTEATVREGTIDVASMSEPASPSAIRHIQVGIGQRVTFSRSAPGPSLASVDPKLAGSWREGRLQFLGEPLENVVGVINRYTAARIELSPAFQQARFTGTVSPTQVNDWLEALEQIYAVEVLDRGSHGILLRSRGGDGSRS
jgi:transmembrane sensor